jgi:hypothetical protein
MGWVPIGHCNKTEVYERTCGPVFAFPWWEIQKNQAYPVFTSATSDQKPPWLYPDGGDKQGQMNAYFRWKNLEDTTKALAMQIWMEQFADKNAVPKESTADITLRRLQQFKVAAGKTCSWTLVRKGKSVAAGTIQPDIAGLLTVPKVTITDIPAEMRLEVKE